MWKTPSAARIRNQAVVMGPNARAMLAVPRDWTRNRVMRMAAEIGSTRAPSSGLTPGASLRPSTAPSTEMAGVMTPSP